MKKKLEPPNLDKYLKTKHKFVSYATGAKLYSLFNAPNTMTSYYQAKVNHDYPEFVQ